MAEKAHSSSGSDSSNRFILCAYIKHGETNYRYRKAHFHTCPKKPLKLVAKALNRPLSNTQTCQNRPGVSKNILCGSIIGHHATPGEAFAEAVLTQHCAPAWSSRDWYRQKASNIPQCRRGSHTTIAGGALLSAKKNLQGLVQLLLTLP